MKGQDILVEAVNRIRDILSFLGMLDRGTERF